MGDYQAQLVAEASSWLIKDPREREEKFRRERIRHYGLARALLLDRLGTDEMAVLEVGGGPLPLSDILRFRSRVVVDPLSKQYATVIPCPDHIALGAEGMRYESEFDLAIATNSLDHVLRPKVVLAAMNLALRPGGYMAIACAENNAITNPHPAHVHNLDADYVHRALDAEYETVWSLDFANDGFRYGWVKHQGRRGQPAFALLMRKCSGYAA